MKILINNKNNFIRTFLTPISKIDNTPDIKIGDNKLTCFVDKGSDIFLFCQYECIIEDKFTDNFVLPDALRLIKAIQCASSDDFNFTIESNHIKYKNKDFKFKYFLFDRSIKKSNEHVYNQLKALEKEYDTKFTLTKDDLKRVLRALPLLTESSKLYLYTDNNLVYGDLCDKKLQNTDVFTSIISEKYIGCEIFKDTIIINLELFRMLNALNFDTAEVYINNKFKVVNIKCTVGESTLNYVVSSHKS